MPERNEIYLKCERRAFPTARWKKRVFLFLKMIGKARNYSASIGVREVAIASAIGRNSGSEAGAKRNI